MVCQLAHKRCSKHTYQAYKHYNKKSFPQSYITTAMWLWFRRYIDCFTQRAAVVFHILCKARGVIIVFTTTSVVANKLFFSCVQTQKTGYFFIWYSCHTSNCITCVYIVILCRGCYTSPGLCVIRFGPTASSHITRVCACAKLCLLIVEQR